ncbi:MAG TPA: hypothetical protein VHH34_02560, partial [Pseudonocardiaceae bacterium]|nr:hypothetical protein [Pseudonocardiaceae bacterium]
MSQISSPLSRQTTSAAEDARFARQAERAAIQNERAEHPEIVRRRYAWWRALITRMIWAAMVIGMAFTMQNVQHFAATTAGHHEPTDIGWWAAWLIDPAVCLVLIGVLLTENLATPEQEHLAPRTHVLKWALIAATYTMNTWQYWADHNAAGVALHSVPVLVVLAAAEVVTDCQGVLTRTLWKIVDRSQQRRDTKDREAADTAQAEQLRQARQQADTARQVADLTRPGQQSAAPIPPPAAPKFQAVPNRPAFTPAVPPAHRPTGPGEQPAGQPDRQPTMRHEDQPPVPHADPHAVQPADRHSERHPVRHASQHG